MMIAAITRREREQPAEGRGDAAPATEAEERRAAVADDRRQAGEDLDAVPAPSARASRTAAVPLSRSRIPDRSASRGPMARIAFAPPVRPLPIVRGSVRPVSRATMMLHGIPPIR